MRRVVQFVAPMVLALVIAGNASATSLTLSFSGGNASVHPGQTATATVTVTKGSTCSISVVYHSGPSYASGLASKKALTSTRLSWSWKVGTTTYAGSWPVTVTCSLGTARRAVTRRLHVL